MLLYVVLFFFVKQKTAYEMRISDWSSDVCSSDLLQLAIDLTREVLRVPDTHRIGIVPGSDTGAVEMAMWTMLGIKPVTMVAWESFGEGWVTDAVKQLKLDATTLKAGYGELPDLNAIDQDTDRKSTRLNSSH